MSRFIDHQEMTADDLIACSYQAQAIIRLCRYVANELPCSEPAAAVGSDIDLALGIACDLIGVMHDALELHEGLREPKFKEAAE